MAGWILRVFHCRGRTLMVTLLKQLVHSRMEYCCVLWTPITQELISLLESVQRNFTSKIMFENHPDPLDYWERLKELKLYSLERRRERYIIIYTWKVVQGLYPNPGILLNTALPVQHLAHPNQGIGITFNDRTGMRVNHVKESTPPLQKKSILTHCCNIYNAIPAHLLLIQHQKSLNSKVNLMPGFNYFLTNPQSPIDKGRHQQTPYYISDTIVTKVN